MIIEVQLTTPQGNQITYFTDAETGRMVNFQSSGKNRITSRIQEAEVIETRLETNLLKRSAEQNIFNKNY